jgi:uncharacterized membrane protein YkoI
MLFTAGTLAAAGSAYGDDHDTIEKAAMAAAAKVTIDQAVKTAAGKVSGKIIEAELEQKHNKLVWEVEVVTAEKRVMEVHIDAETGAIIDVEEEQAKPVRSPKER